MEHTPPFFLADDVGVMVGRSVPSDDVDVAKAWELTRPDDDAAWARAAAAIHDALPVGVRRVNPLLVDDWAAVVHKSAGEGPAAFLCSAPTGVQVDPGALVAELAKHAAPWIVEVKKWETAPAAAWSWQVEGLPSRTFVSSNEPPRDPRFVSVVGPAGARTDKLTKSTRRIALLRKDGQLTTEQRLVYGVVLQPEVVDSQNDIYSADEVARAAHLWMESYQNTGYQHQTLVNEGVKPVESYVSPCDFEMGGQQVKAGTWVLVVHVLSDAIWAQIKAGELTGFSIGGYAQRVPAAQIDGQPA